MPAAVFVFGLIVGSFLNAVIHRLYTNESIVSKRSRCPHCGHKLAPRDLIPLASFFILRGKCRYCDKPISWQYPLVELATGIAFVLIYISTSPGLRQAQATLPRPGEGGGEVELLFQFIFASFLIVIFVYDLKHYLILDKVVLPAALLAFVYQFWLNNLVNALLGVAVLSGFFLLLYLFSDGKWIGFGDIKLGIFLGLLTPWPLTLVLFFLAYLTGAFVSLCLVGLKLKKITDRVPFGTFLTFSAFIAMLWGEEMVRWYFNLIGIG